MEKRFFTLEEARELLPSVNDWMGKARSLAGCLDHYREAVTKLAENAQMNQGGPEGTAYFTDLIRLQNYLVQIQNSGCVVKSIEEGLADFPHLKNGREVYLCWKYGEDDIHFWHEVDAGFAGRTPISDSESGLERQKK